MTLDSNLSEAHQATDLSSSGRVSVSLDRVDLQLGRYSVDVSVRSGEQIGLDHLQACGWMTVLPGPRTAPVIFREGHGIRQPGLWHWEETDGT